MAKLYIYPKGGESYIFLLKKSIGRSADNDIPISDPFCSGQHAFIYPSNGGYVIRDNKSKNGTFLNGTKIQAETELKKGDEVLMGSTRIIFDKKLEAKVEVTETPSPSTNVNTIIDLKDVLKKQDIDTTLKTVATPLDVLKIKADHKAYSILTDVSQALLLHMPLNELLDRIMDLISQNLPMDRGILMIKEGHPAQLIPKVVRINNKNLKDQKIQISQSIIKRCPN